MNLNAFNCSIWDKREVIKTELNTFATENSLIINYSLKNGKWYLG